MPERTANLSLPLLMPSQAQKHLTHNEALIALDAMVQLSVKARTGSEPADPAEGARFLVAAPASGAFQGEEGRVALRQYGGWRFLAPGTGWIAFVEAEGVSFVFDGSAWTEQKVRRTDRLGIGATADDGNRLTVSSEAVLLDHAGGDSRLKINKAKSGGTASVLFQEAYSGRAEFGLAGSGGFALKLSADGATWQEAMRFDPATGHAGLGTVPGAARLDIAGPVRLGQYGKAHLPDAAACGAGTLIYVADDALGPVLAFSDGAAWRRTTDRNLVG